MGKVNKKFDFLISFYYATGTMLPERRYLIPPFYKRYITLYLIVLIVMSGLSFPYRSGEIYIPRSIAKQAPETLGMRVEPLTVTEDTKNSGTKSVNNEDWGIAKQIDEHTWTMKIGEDERMGGPREIVDALNKYRQRHGKGTLTWDEKLAEYAQTRTNFFASNKKLDGHAGFSKFVDEEDGFTKLGFSSLGENSSIGYRMEGVHLIEWIYAGDKPHDDNQLNSKWTHVGVGVTGTATNLIFAVDRL